MANERDGTRFVGAWVPVALADAFDAEAGAKHGAKTRILREMLSARYTGKRALTPGQRALLAAVEGLDESPEALDAALRFAREAANPATRRTALVLAESLARHAPPGGAARRGRKAPRGKG